MSQTIFQATAIMNNNDFCCKLEGFHDILFKNDPNVNKENSTFFKREVYTKTFNNIDNLKQHVVSCTKAWIRCYPEKERYLSDEYWQRNKIGNLLDEKRDLYPGFLILNRWKDWRTIGYCYKGWHLIGNEFSKYLNKYIIDLHGVDNLLKYQRKLDTKNFLFLIPQAFDDFERKLISNEIIDIELRHFLYREEITKKIEQEVFYPEMVRRGYIDILDKKSDLF